MVKLHRIFRILASNIHKPFYYYPISCFSNIKDEGEQNKNFHQACIHLLWCFISDGHQTLHFNVSQSLCLKLQFWSFPIFPLEIATDRSNTLFLSIFYPTSHINVTYYIIIDNLPFWNIQKYGSSIKSIKLFFFFFLNIFKCHLTSQWMKFIVVI